MSEPHYIQSYCIIRNNQVLLNGQLQPIGINAPFSEWMKILYQQLNLDYPKFFKMDELCKLSFIATEFTLHDFPLHESKEGDTALVFSNSSSTLSTDRKHQDSIQNEENYFPSPSIFVYTLPNIAIGEITIRHKLKGENTFFITEKFDTEFISQYTGSLMQNHLAGKVITGWVNYEPEGYDCFICLSGKDRVGQGLDYNKGNLDILYKSVPLV